MSQPDSQLQETEESSLSINYEEMLSDLFKVIVRYFHPKTLLAVQKYPSSSETRNGSSRCN